MISGALANIIKEKITYTKLIMSIFIIGLLGVGLQFFEPYPMFWLLFPILLIMLVSVILILQFCLKELQKFQEKCEAKEIQENCTSLFTNKNSPLLLIIYVLMVIVYFVCLYKLQFVEINLMGLYVLLLGGATFFLALISYEVCVRLTLSLKKTEKNIDSITYDQKFPSDTLWLQYFYRLYKVLTSAALVISILFVLENSMLFIANYEKLFPQTLQKEAKTIELLRHLPIEWWIIWIYIFATIIVALPLMKHIQSRSLKTIILHIQTTFKMDLMKHYEWENLCSNPQNYCFVLSTIQFVENALERTYLPRKIDRLITFGASLLTCCAHLISFCMIFISV